MLKKVTKMLEINQQKRQKDQKKIDKNFGNSDKNIGKSLKKNIEKCQNIEKTKKFVFLIFHYLQIYH